jgi:hypothetical protein
MKLPPATHQRAQVGMPKRVSRSICSSRQNLSMSASLIGRLGSSTFRLSTTPVSMSLTGSRFSSESAPRPFHHGSKTRWNNLRRGLAVRRTAGPSGHANSPHPSSRKGHHSTARWSSEFPSIGLDPARFSCCRRLFLGPAERGAVDPDAVHDHGQGATIAFFIPRRLAICIAQALSQDHFFERSIL